MSKPKTDAERTSKTQEEVLMVEAAPTILEQLWEAWEWEWTPRWNTAAARDRCCHGLQCFSLYESLCHFPLESCSFPNGSVVKNLRVMQETQEMQVWSLGGEDSQEKETATFSSILDWIIAWTGEPDGLQPMGFRRVGHNWAHACIS